ncbi:cytochrome P450 [Melanogaster broomeanus]|nr:cytochrome P450 [Melanogaster broomeanus]
MVSAGLLLGGLAVALAVSLVAVDRMRWSKLDDIPAVGPSGHLSSYYGAAKFILHAKSMTQEGYNLYKDSFFRVPMMDRWTVVVTGPQLIEELRKIPDAILSFDHAMQDLLQVKYTFGVDAQTKPYHLTAVQGHLKRKLGNLFPELHDEICRSFEEMLPLKETDWVSVPAYPAVMKATCRTSNRIFVGTRICQSTEFADVQTKFALQVVLRASLVNFFPRLIHPIIGRILTNTPSSLRSCMALLHPIVEERLRIIKEQGDNSPTLPDDMITWLLQVSKEEDRNLRNICLRILVLNFASLHTSTGSFTHALLNLASHPQHQGPLRREVQEVTEKYGWTKDSMSMLIKMESFLRESQRINTLTLFPIVRKAMDDITFSNGTTIPTGTLLAVAAVPMHLDDRFYSNASEFDPFRFSSMRETGEASQAKYKLASTNLCYLPFGHGPHACPGRFFASTLSTAMMAHLVLHYDIKLKEGIRPPDQWFMMNCSPNKTAEIMFRRRLPS